jgi:hypothetical protein
LPASRVLDNPASTSRSISDIYASMLACAHDQVEAIREDDWATVLQMSEERAGLLAASQNALAAGQVEDPEEASRLLKAVLSFDATTAQLLSTKREVLRDDLRNLRQTSVAAVGYASPVASEAGYLVDSFR